jgi:hypothetical protein
MHGGEMKYLAAGVLVAGCGGSSVKGEIDGQFIDIQSGYFAQEDNVDAESGDGAIIVTLSSLEDTCASDAQNSADADEVDDASDLADSWKESFPEDFWTVRLVVQVTDPGDPLKDEVFDGVAWDEVPTEDGEVTGTIIHFTAFLDEEYWNSVLGGPGVDLEDYFEAWYTDGGDLEITGHTVDEFIKGRFTTEAATTDDGDTSGQLEIKFAVDRCTEMERYLFVTE